MKGNCFECSRRWTCEIDPDDCDEWPDPVPMEKAKSHTVDADTETAEGGVELKIEKENVRIILGKFLDDMETWVDDGKEAVKQLAYISGLRDMANAVIEAIDELEDM